MCEIIQFPGENARKAAQEAELEKNQMAVLGVINGLTKTIGQIPRSQWGPFLVDVRKFIDREGLRRSRKEA